MRLTIPLLIAGLLWGNPTEAEQKGSERQAINGAFSGAYYGLDLSAASGSGTSEYPLLPAGTTYERFNPKTGAATSGFIGYNFQRGNLVYGGELQYSRLHGIRPKFADSDPDMEAVADLRGRLGYVVGDAMYYGTLGFSAGIFHLHPGSAYGDGIREHDLGLFGFSLSAGVEYNFYTRWFAGGEITYRKQRGRFFEASRDTNIEVNTFSLRLGYRF